MNKKQKQLIETTKGESQPLYPDVQDRIFCHDSSRLCL